MITQHGTQFTISFLAECCLVTSGLAPLAEQGMTDGLAWIACLLDVRIAVLLGQCRCRFAFRGHFALVSSFEREPVSVSGVDKADVAGRMRGRAHLPPTL